jgi:hypothetical protein
MAPKKSTPQKATSGQTTPMKRGRNLEVEISDDEDFRGEDGSRDIVEGINLRHVTQELRHIFLEERALFRVGDALKLSEEFAAFATVPLMVAQSPAYVLAGAVGGLDVVCAGTRQAKKGGGPCREAAIAGFGLCAARLVKARGAETCSAQTALGRRCPQLRKQRRYISSRSCWLLLSVNASQIFCSSTRTMSFHTNRAVHQAPWIGEGLPHS